MQKRSSLKFVNDLTIYYGLGKHNKKTVSLDEIGERYRAWTTPSLYKQIAKRYDVPASRFQGVCLPTTR